jgi:hypothetical protein
MKGMNVLNPSRLISSIPDILFLEQPEDIIEPPYHNLAKQQELASLTNKG